MIFLKHVNGQDYSIDVGNGKDDVRDMGREMTFTVRESCLLLSFLIARLPGKGRNKVKALLTHHQVAVDNRVVTEHDYPLKVGQCVMIQERELCTKGSLSGIQILYEDRDLIIIDKPNGLLSIATHEERQQTAYHILTDYVKHNNPQERVYVVHRLDKDTSGVMMFAKRDMIKQALQNAWKESVLERSYVAVVEGEVRPSTGIITSWLKESSTHTMYVTGNRKEGQKAITHYKVKQLCNGYSLLEVQLDTGRKNQIRVHMQSIGHSVVGDSRYGSTKDPFGRLGLHARVLSFRHPVTHKILYFETEIPSQFRRLFL